MNNLVSLFIFAAVLLLPFALIIIDIIFFVKKKESGIFEGIAFFIAAIYFLLGYGLWDLPGYETALNIYGSVYAHEPFSSEHSITLIVFIVFGFVCYMVLKFLRKTLPPLAEVILLGGVYISCVIQIVGIFQLICGAHPEGIDSHVDEYFYIFCLCSVPVIFLVHVTELMVRLALERAEKQATVNYENPVLQKLNFWFLNGANLFLVAVVALLPILVIIMMILCLFGQQPDSIILAFTKTSDWILSKEVAPPPVAYDEHYLCTVSLRGHEKIVKPIRCGVRKGRKIIVNRQLCVANAFEQLIMEKTPGFHRVVRNFYDKYGYPLSRHINSAWSADVTYFIMKPLEWVFVVVLYLFDREPETRICRQYLPID